MKNKKRIKVALTISLVLVVLLSGSIGYLFGNHNFVLTQKHAIEFIKSDIGQPKDVDFSLFWEAYSKLKNSYQGTIEAKKFLYGAIEGGFASTGDPYTVFLPPDISSEFEKEISGKLEGIGIKIGILDNTPAVIAPLNDSPAQKAGLKPKDKIIKVDDIETKDILLDEVVYKIRGAEGTTVKLEVLRDGEQNPRVFEIKRAKIDVKTVEVSYKDDVGIIALNEFGTNTREDFLNAAKQMSDKGISKIILDLRDNPGGLLDGAIDVSGELFSKDTTVVFEDSKSGKTEHKTIGTALLKQAKLVVLVNGGSASSAEIVAGAIKDHKRGTIIGEKTFGKGTVQQLEPLSDGSSVKITVARWLTPTGQSIDKNGIMPDIEVKSGDNPLFDQNDPIMKRAIEEFAK